MKSRLRVRCVALFSITCAALLAAQSAGASSHPHEVYLGTGLFGSVGGGYAHNFVDIFGVRAEFTGGRYSRKIDLGQFHYDAGLKTSQLGAYADWFPFGGKFHLSAGLRGGNQGLDVDARFQEAQEIEIGRVKMGYGGPEDTATAKVKWPTVAPYLGFGFGHSTAQRAGLGFVADFGVSLGAPGVEFSISDALREKLDMAVEAGNKMNGTRLTADGEIERERQELAKDASKFKVFPHMYVGVAYRF